MKNVYVSECKNLMDEWDWEENEKYNLSPYKITTGSAQKAHWICTKGHKWSALVSNRARGTTCPYCSNKKVLSEYNDLQTINPILAAEWNYEKNGDLKPTDVMPGSNKKVWWICIKGHEWQAKITDRNHGSGCPECAKERHTSFQEQALYYYLKKITTALNREPIHDKEIDIYLPDINVGIEYNGSYYHRNKDQRDEKKIELLKSYGINMFVVKEGEIDFIDGNIITYRFGKSLDWAIAALFSLINLPVPLVDTVADRIKIWEQYILAEKENSLAVKNPQLAQEWHPTKNGKLTPDLVSYGSGKIVWWLGKCGHEWDMSVSKRTRGYNCPICSNKRIVSGINDLATTHPNLLKEWCYEKNTDIYPDQITFGSNEKVWWQCSFGHIYPMYVYHKTSGIGCPVCSGQMILPGVNDLATKYPALLKEWDYEKNTILPSEVSPGNHTRVWWKCAKQHSWQTSINNRTNNKTMCPTCAAIAAPIRISSSRNTSGIIGVSFDQRIQKWHATMQYNKMPVLSKKYDNKEDAIYARLEAEARYYGEDAPQRHLFEQYKINVDSGDTDD